MTASIRDRKLGRRSEHTWRLRLRQDGSSSRHVIVEALRQALLAADPRTIVRTKTRLEEDRFQVSSLSVRLSKFRRVLVIGGGKASAGMALEIERVLDGWVTGGSVNIPVYARPRPRSSRISFNPATHPVPSEKGVRGVKDMLRLVGQPSEKDLVICLISGGGSALMPFPWPGVSLSDKEKTTRLLLKSGARIEEMNTVRKHLSGIKGGRLAEKLYPAEIVSLIISDVVGDPLGSIASGPTVPDSTTYADACNVLQRHGLWRRVPDSIRKCFQQGKEGKLPETPKPDSPIFKRVYNILIGNNKQSCEAAASALKERGYHTLIISTRLQGEAREVGKTLSSIVSDIRDNQVPVSPPAAIVAGGETTVTVHGKGRGGRNQELVLSAALSIRGISGVLVSSIGTDGVDGPTDAAGAVADGDSVERGLRKHLDADAFLRENDSYTFLKRLNDLVITGPTGTNVNDIMIAIVDGANRKRDTGRLSAGR